MNSKTANNFTDTIGMQENECPVFEEVEFEDYKFEEIELQVYETPKLQLKDLNELTAQDDIFLSDYSDTDEPEEPPRPNSTVKDVAVWMKEKLEENEPLYQTNVVRGIIRIFGDQFSYMNSNGNPAINKEVLKEFRKITPEYKWSKSGFYWRKQQQGDDPKRRDVV